MLLSLLMMLASASECPPLGDLVEEAWFLYNDAEIEAAESKIEEAREHRGCQRVLIKHETLLELHFLDALLAITLEDDEAAQAAMIRAVAVEPTDGRPPAEYGPDLIALYEHWSGVLAEARVEVSVRGGGIVYVDGRSASRSSPLSVLPGEHLVQVAETGLIVSHVTEIQEDQVVHTGLPEDAGVVLEAVRPSEPEPEPEAPAEVPTDSTPQVLAPEAPGLEPRVQKRRHPWGWFVGGGVVLAGSGGLGFWTRQQEKLFLEATYNGNVYGSCRRSQACWARERERAIRQDGREVQIFYGLSYALAGVGAGMTLAGVWGVPVTTDGETVQLTMRW